jgi:hypothetical protein
MSHWQSGCACCRCCQACSAFSMQRAALLLTLPLPVLLCRQADLAQLDSLLSGLRLEQQGLSSVDR